MADEVEKMQKDLAEKLDRLCQIHDQPEVFLVEHFMGLRNTIDYEAEKILQEQQENILSNDVAEVTKLNKTRVDFIGFLEEQEKICLEKISDKKTQQPSSEAYAPLKNRIGEFQAKNKESDIYDIEEAYLKLALDLVDETHDLVSRLLNNQTIAYVPTEAPDRLGGLLFLDQCYISQDDLNAIRGFQNRNYFEIRDIFEGTITLLNNSLAVSCSSRRLLTLSHMILYNLVHFFTSRTTDSKFFYLGASKKAFFGEDSPVTQELVSDHTENIAISLKYYRISGYDNLWNIFDSHSSSIFSISHGNFALKSWNSCLSTFFECLVELFITSAELKAFKGDLIAKCVNLETLGIFYISVDENIGDLLRDKTLIHLELESDSQLYTSLTLPKLDKQTFVDLSSINRLSSLSLYGFEIEVIDAQTFADFPELKGIHLERSRIGFIDKDSFKNCPSLIGFTSRGSEIQNFHFNTLEQLETIESIDLEGVMIKVLEKINFNQLENLTNLTLSSCGIRELSTGVFDSLAKLESLDLEENYIKRVTCEMFGKLACLKNLLLNSNPIETIDPDAFCNLGELLYLYIIECKLKSINNQMFNGLKSLKQLDLRNNEIECIEIITESSHIKLANSNMKPDEFELVKQHLFKDLTRLTYLKLSSNKLSKFDLNWLINLANLEDLYLDQNAISELNREAKLGLLPKLGLLLLQANSLSFIDKNAFSQSPRLTVLNLSGNKLDKLEDSFFNAFPNLETLNLSNNKLNMEINKDTFANCRALEKVILQGNESVRVMDGAFENLPAESHLKFELPPPNFHGLPGAVESVTLEKVDSEALKTFFNSKTKDNESPFVKIRTISLNTGRIPENDQPRSLDLDFLASLNHLLDLSLSSVLIESLDESNVFSSLSKLESLRLINNDLKSINRHAFKGLVELRTIEISKNSNLSNIDVGLFRGLFRLAFVDLSSNNFTFIDLGKLLKPCRRLAALDLSNNQLDNRSIDALTSIQFYNLTSLSLANNRLENMDFVFKFPRLDELDLSNNKIESIKGVDDDLLNRLVRTGELNPRGNEIRDLINKMLGIRANRCFCLNLSNNPLKLKLDKIIGISSQ